MKTDDLRLEYNKPVHKGEFFTDEYVLWLEGKILKSNQTKEYLIAKLESDLAIEKERYELKSLYNSHEEYKEYPDGSSNAIKEIERQLKELTK